MCIRDSLATAKQRVSELEVLLCRIYEDNILGKLSDSRYATLDAQYDKEQYELTAEISALENAEMCIRDRVIDANRAVIDQHVPRLELALVIGDPLIGICWRSVSPFQNPAK